MSIASLSKFTVPLASGQSSTTQGMLMPKLQYRFRVMFENFGVSGSTTELTKQVGKAARPNVDFGMQTIDVYNSKINLPQKPSWKAIAVTLRDDVTGAVAKLVGEQLQKQYDFMEQSSAASGGNYKFTMAIEMLDGGNGATNAIVLERWECYGCFIQTANYNSLDYAQTGPQTIDLSIQPDNCIQTISGASGQRGTMATLSGSQ
jgi:hypothetical protein